MANKNDKPGGCIDFKKIEAEALASSERLVPTWLPDGRREGNEWCATNPTRNDAHRGSFKINLTSGKWQDFATGDAGGNLVSLYAYIFDLQQAAAAREIAVLLGMQVDASVDLRAAPSTGKSAEAAPKTVAAAEWEWLAPDTEARPAPVAHAVRGKPESLYVYRGLAGELLGYIQRFKNSEGGKEFIPLTYWRNVKSGLKKWRSAQFPDPRPLYGLDRLAGRENDKILIVEGEKCADDAQWLLGDKLVVMTWPGGAEAIKKVDWSPLAGRAVILWPDLDDPGFKAMAGVGKILRALGCDVQAAAAEQFLGVKPKGWDISDAAEEGWTAEKISDFFGSNVRMNDSAPVAMQPSSEVTPGAVWADSVSGAALGAADPDFYVPENVQRSPPPKTKSTPQPPTGEGAIYADPHNIDPRPWFSQLKRAESGAIKPLLCNLMLILEHHEDWAGALGFDQFSELIVKLRPPPWQVGKFKPGHEWSEVDDYRLRHWLSSHFFEAKEKDIIQAVTLISHAHKFHPLIERMDALVWDGTSRVRTWLIDYLGVCKGKRFERLDAASQDLLLRYTEGTGIKWLVGAVGRVYEANKPNAITGSQMDMMLILEGEQGIMKSTALRVLGGEWFTDEKLDFGNKDSFMILQGRHIIEMAELEGLNKSEASATKNFITKREDLFRAPYGRKMEKKPRRCVFAGSVNHDHYLKDDSGNRRFFPVYCTTIDMLNLTADVDQLWAEALSLYRSGVKWWVEPHERELFAVEQDKRFQADVWEESIEDFCIGRDSVSMGEILFDALKIEKARWDAQAQKRVGSILTRRMGWEKLQVSENGKRPRRYFRPDTDPNAPARATEMVDDEPF